MEEWLIQGCRTDWATGNLTVSSGPDQNNHTVCVCFYFIKRAGSDISNKKNTVILNRPQGFLHDGITPPYPPIW